MDNEKRIENLENSMKNLTDMMGTLLKEIKTVQNQPPPYKEEVKFYFSKDAIFDDASKLEFVQIFTKHDAEISDKTRNDIMEEKNFASQEEFDRYIESHTYYVASVKYGGKTYENEYRDVRNLIFFKKNLEQWTKKKIF